MKTFTVITFGAFLALAAFSFTHKARATSAQHVTQCSGGVCKTCVVIYDDRGHIIAVNCP